MCDQIKKRKKKKKSDLVVGVKKNMRDARKNIKNRAKRAGQG